MILKSTKYIENKPNHIFMTICHEGAMFAHMLVNGTNGEIENVFYRKKYRKQKQKKNHISKDSISESFENFISRQDFYFSDRTKIFEFTKNYKNPLMPIELKTLLEIYK